MKRRSIKRIVVEVAPGNQEKLEKSLYASVSGINPIIKEENGSVFMIYEGVSDCPLIIAEAMSCGARGACTA